MLTGTLLGSALRQAIALKGVRQVEVAKHFGVKPPSVQDWMNRGVIAKEHLPGLWAYFADTVSPSHWGLEQYPTGPQDANTTDGPDPTGPYPLISDVQAGDWTELADSFQAGDAEEWLPSPYPLGTGGYMLRVVGKSMLAPGEPYSFQEGMVLHVNPELEPRPGQFVIVRREDAKAATFKRYVLIDGAPYLEAINPDWPKELKYLQLQPGDAWCGVVVGATLRRLP